MRLRRLLAYAPVALLVVLLAIACCAAPAIAQTKTPDAEIPVGTPVGGDAQDIIFIDDAHALFIRLHLQLNGLGFREAWETFADKFFDYADANGDGSLNSAEVSRAARMLGVSTSLAAMDTSPKDGKVTKQEWTAALARFGEPQFSAGGQRNGGFVFAANGLMMGGGDNPGSALSKLLDTNSDSVLTKEELTAAPRVLRKFDLDDDEMIAASELRPYDTSAYRQYFVAGSAYGAPTQSDGPTVLVIPSRGDVTPVAGQLLDRLDGRDKKKDQKLSPKELPIAKEEFAAADANHDGLLDLQEIKRLLGDLKKNVVKPQLALVVRQGPEAGRRGKFALAAVDGKPASLVGSLRGNPRGMLTLDVGTLQLQFTAADWNVGPVDYERSYKPQFVQFDQDGNGYIDKKEVENFGMAEQFDQMDRDHNGMVFLKEFVDYYRQQAEVSQSRISLQGNDQGKLLFDLLDTNRDGRLSPRDLAEAPAKLPQWDRSRDGKLEEGEIPRQYTLHIGRGGNQANTRTVPVAFNGGGRPTAVPQPGAPAWFTKMDRNRDGDVSRREFLGPTELFDRLDLNHDGQLDAAEAAKAADRK